MSETSLAAENVFTPTAFPEHTYVNRNFYDTYVGTNFDPDVKIQEGLNTKGMFISIVGPSKSGKTISIKKVVGKENLVEIPGSEIQSNGDFWKIALQKLGVALEEKTGTKTTEKKGSEVGAKVGVGGVGLHAKDKQEKEEANEYIKTLTSSSLDLLRAHATGKILLIDDFHYLPPAQQTIVAQQIKSAAEGGVKICIAEVPHGTHSLIRSNSDLVGRYERVDFSYWQHDDLVKIAEEGFSRLVVGVSNATMHAFAKESAGSPQLMQRICLAAARYLAQYYPSRKNITLDASELSNVMLRASSRDRETVIENLIKGPPTRGTERNSYNLRNNENADVYATTLLALTLNPPKMSLSKEELVNRISDIVNGAIPPTGSVTSSLGHMKNIVEKHEQTIRLLDVGNDGQVHIMDPYFFFELRWYPPHRDFRNALTNGRQARLNI